MPGIVQTTPNFACCSSELAPAGFFKKRQKPPEKPEILRKRPENRRRSPASTGTAARRYASRYREHKRKGDTMTGRIEARLKELGIELPKAGEVAGNYVPFVRSGDLLFLAGQLPIWMGERRFAGKLGREFSIEQGQQAARICGLNLLSFVKTALGGDLDRVLRCVRLGGFVNSTEDFSEQPQVVNGCSNLMVEVLGDQGRHARTAVGVNVLPFNLAVEVDGIFEVR